MITYSYVLQMLGKCIVNLNLGSQIRDRTIIEDSSDNSCYGSNDMSESQCQEWKYRKRLKTVVRKMKEVYILCIVYFVVM
jgi:hypothetical protein